jgi:hypothetical protein
VSAVWRCALILVVAAPSPCIAGEIPGLPPQLPPFIERDLEVAFSNDFLGRGGSVDDFRTQQLIVTAKLSDRWMALLDHSILTLNDPTMPGRIDQVSGSLGYRAINTVNNRRVSKLVIGIGIRNVGEFAGERIQNGFHRLVGSKTVNLPYSDTEDSVGTAWFDANHYREFTTPVDTESAGKWHTGYWLRVSSLLTSGGQWDSSAGLYAVASKQAIDIWLGIRRDWRSGYEGAVLRETAAAEDDLAIVLGARFGALVLETVQQVNNDASYGQLRLVSSGVRTTASRNRNTRLGLEAGFLLPDIQLRLAGRFRQRVFTNDGSRWREAIVIAASYGEPQVDDNATIFIRSKQFDVGLDYERPLFEQSEWLSAYGTASAGWRDEQLIGADTLEGESSDSVGGAVLSIGAGFRIDAAELGERWNFRIQLGLIGRLPFQDADLQIGAVQIRVQEPALDFMLGMTFDFD